MPRSADPSIAVFDIGGVLIDWNPRYLYRKLFAEDTAAMEEFLATVCTPDWNLQQDAGRPWKEAVEELSARHPEKAELIAAYDLEWDEMVPGPIPDTADIVWDLKRRGQKVCCITNFSVDKLDRARRRFDVLNAVDNIVVSGERPYGIICTMKVLAAATSCTRPTAPRQTPSASKSLETPQKALTGFLSSSL